MNYEKTKELFESKPPHTRMLTQDIRNPEYDGRYKHGLKAIKEFKAGTYFEFLGLDNQLNKCPRIFFHNQEFNLFFGSFGFTILENSEETEEVLSSFLTRYYFVCAEDILRGLLDNKMVTIQQIKTVVEAIDQNFE